MAERRKSYAEQLKDPRWQKKRLEILSDRNWKCEECGETERTLHIHHRHYSRDLMAWEYDDHTLAVVCDRCHEQVQYEMERVHFALACLRYCPVDRFIGYLVGAQLIGVTTSGKTEEYLPRSEDECFGIADAFRVDPYMLIADMKNGVPIDAMKLWIHAVNLAHPDDAPPEKE